jgi:hypothetical protein
MNHHFISPTNHLTIENSNSLRPLDIGIPRVDPPSYLLAAVSTSHEWADTALSTSKLGLYGSPC